jgi:F-type H+-transporting ATPase subunit b
MTIDWWTLGIQTINVAVLVWLLQRFFWRPVAAVIEQRRNATMRTMSEADAAKIQATAALAEIEQTRAGFVKEREAILAAARADAETTRTALLADARQQAASLEAAAKAAIVAANVAAAEAWTERAARLAVDIAAQLVARLDGAAVRAAFLDRLVQQIAGRNDTKALNGATLEVISAMELDVEEQQRTRERIVLALGGDPPIVFRTEPALIAGLELRGPHLLVSNSWHADLERILACLIERGKADVASHLPRSTVGSGEEFNSAEEPRVH